MSNRSAQGDKTPKEETSNHNNPQPSVVAHSAVLQQTKPRQHNQEWVAAFIDGQYYLTDPESMRRLKDIQTQIELEKSKLAKLQIDPKQFNQSFLSLQDQAIEKKSNKSFCNTEFNQNKHNHKQEKVKNQLQNEEDKYKDKIRKMEKERSQMKKGMAPVSQQQVTKGQQQQNHKPSEKNNSKKSVLQEQSKKDSVCPEVKSVRKSSRKSIRESSKQKSYHKSRIQQSIKDNIEQHGNKAQITEAVPVMAIDGEKSLASHQKNKPPSSHGQQSPNIERSSQKDMLYENKSNVKSVQKSSRKGGVIEQQPSNKAQSIKKSQKKQVSLRPSSNNGETVKIEEDKVSKCRSRISSVIKANESKVEDSSKISQYNVKINAVGSVHQSNIYPSNDAPQKAEVKQQLRSQKQLIDVDRKSQRISSGRLKEDVVDGRKSQKNIEQVKSKRSSHIEEEAKSKYSNIILFDQVKSKKHSVKSSAVPHQQTKSRKSYRKQEQDGKSSEPVEEVKSKKSSIHRSAQAQIAQDTSKLGSQPNQSIKQHKSQKSSKNRSIKKEPSELDQKSRHSQMSQKLNSQHSRSMKEGKSEKKGQESRIQAKELQDKSCQYSRVTDPIQQSRAQQTVTQNMSDKNSSLIQHHEESVNESSSLRDVIQVQLKQQEKQQIEKVASPESPFKKKKQESLKSIKDNQNQKKSRSFIIHSRNGSVKERTEKQFDQLSSKYSNRKSVGKQPESPSMHTESVTKEELFKLNQQISFLKQKLKKVQQKQDLMQKGQINVSKIKSSQPQESLQFTPSPQVPAQINFQSLSSGLRPHGHLQLQSSIIQVDTTEDTRKKLQKQGEVHEKVKLKDQISRLKKIIRDMQIQKIKSIDLDNQLGESSLSKKGSKQFSLKDSRASRDKESINHFEGMQTQKRFWGKSRVEQAGRIIKNNIQSDKSDISPRRRIQHIKLMGSEDEVVMEPEQLPYESSKKNSFKFMNEGKHHSLIDRLHGKEKEFHHFMESSRMLVEEEHTKQPIEQPNHDQTPSSNFQQFSQISVSNSASHTPKEPANKINYSRLVEEFKKHNPEEDEVLPQIHLRDLKVQQIPNTPTPSMSQDDLLELAKRAYQVFGIDVQEEDKQLCVKKYKNCVVFSITNNLSECILWHFSGKFYMGGWKAGQPGEGQKHGEGLQIIPDKYIYKGQFLNGKKNGTGILKLANGNIYDGQWIDGLKNGRGVYLDAATRVIYSGEWKEGKKDGQGYLKLSDKQYYYGTFNKSVKEGFGVQIFVNGDKYKGQYKNGKFHSKGKYTWVNGSCYEGQFVEGVRQGQGSWKSTNNNGDIYIGTYEADKKNGYGRYVWANGCIYEGYFSNDVKDGKGRLTYQDGKEVKGTWEQGNLVKTQHDKQPIDHQDQPLRRSVKASSFAYQPSTTPARRF